MSVRGPHGVPVASHVVLGGHRRVTAKLPEQPNAVGPAGLSRRPGHVIGCAPMVELQLILDAAVKLDTVESAALEVNN